MNLPFSQSIKNSCYSMCHRQCLILLHILQASQLANCSCYFSSPSKLVGLGIRTVPKWPLLVGVERNTKHVQSILGPVHMLCRPSHRKTSRDESENAHSAKAKSNIECTPGNQAKQPTARKRSPGRRCGALNAHAASFRLPGGSLHVSAAI